MAAMEAFTPITSGDEPQIPCHSVSSQLLVLPKAVLHHVLVYLSARDLCSLTKTCKQLEEACDEAHVWGTLAFRTWPENTLQVAPYNSLKELVLDSNRKGACHEISLAGSACVYRYARFWYWFQCQLISLQHWRTPDSLRLYFESRGEMDLRDPITSSLAVIEVPLRCVPNSNDSQPTTETIPLSAAAARILITNRHNQKSSSSSSSRTSLAGSSQGVNDSTNSPASASQSGMNTSSSSGGSGPAKSDKLLLEALEEFPWQHVWEHAAGNPSWWYKKHRAWHPDASQLFEGQEGHYKGCLIWHKHQLQDIRHLMCPPTSKTQRNHIGTSKSPSSSSTSSNGAGASGVTGLQETRGT